jgi:hypothetical protein
MSNKFLSRGHYLDGVACLFLLAAAFGAYRYWLPSQQQSSGVSCIYNLKQIEGSKWCWMDENHKTTNDAPTWSDLVGTNLYMRDRPKCPHGGFYTIGKVGERASCSNTNDDEYYRTSLIGK